MAAAQAPSDVVARVGDRDITVEDLESPLANRLYDLQQQIHQLKQQRLEALIDRRAMEKEAAETGTSIEALTRSVMAEAVQVTDADVERYYQENQQRLAGWKGPKTALMDQIRTFLQDRENNRKVAEHAAPLREKYGVTVFLKAPPLPFTTITEGDSPALGPADAPVTVIEFSDYLCPACRAAHETTKQVPRALPGAHPVGVQGLSARTPQRRQTPGRSRPVRRRPGRVLGISGPAVRRKGRIRRGSRPDVCGTTRAWTPIGSQACLDSGRHLPAIEADIESGRSAGVGATPTFIVNGRLRPGAPDFEGFRELIDGALTRSDP